jgi:lipopolysaccharide heptosyltransferase I
VPDPQRILLIRPSALGDVCKTVPVLASLRRRYPAASIDWLVNDTFAPAIAGHPALTRVVPFPRRRFGALWKPTVAREFLAWLGGLRRARYDLVIDAQGLFRSGLFAWATRSRRRVGYANARELGWIFLNERHPIPPTLHAVDRMLALVEAAGAPPTPDMRLYATDEARSGAASELRRAGATGRVAVVAPTSRWEGKRWPAERFAELSRRLLAEGVVDSVVIVGAPGERGQCAPLLALAQDEPRVVDLIGRTTVGELLAIVEHAAIVIANDSAALHMAVGFDRPMVGLFGPTRVGRVGPYGRADAVLQRLRPGEALDHKDRGSGTAMMARISVQDAFDAALTSLRENRRVPAHTS